jgi:hypothetical protein
MSVYINNTLRPLHGTYNRHGSTHVFGSHVSQDKENLVKGVEKGLTTADHEHLHGRGVANQRTKCNHERGRTEFRVNQRGHGNREGKASVLALFTLEQAQEKFDDNVGFHAENREHHGKAHGTDTVVLEKGHEVAETQEKHGHNVTKGNVLLDGVVLLTVLGAKEEERNQNDLRGDKDGRHGGSTRRSRAGAAMPWKQRRCLRSHGGGCLSVCWRLCYALLSNQPTEKLQQSVFCVVVVERRPRYFLCIGRDLFATSALGEGSLVRENVSRLAKLQES